MNKEREQLITNVAFSVAEEILKNARYYSIDNLDKYIREQLIHCYELGIGDECARKTDKITSENVTNIYLINSPIVIDSMNAEVHYDKDALRIKK